MSNFKFYNFKTLNSTNDKAKILSSEGKYNLVVIAQKQEKGRGRFGRKWCSEIGGLYMTIVLKEENLDKVKYLTLIASVSVAKSIRRFSNLNAKVKWPNDILIDDKKICGILTETVSGKENYALIGIGLNVNNIKFPKNIMKKSTSLKLESNKKYDIEKISRIVIKEFNIMYNYYNKKKYNKIIDIWKKYSHTLRKKIKAKTLSKVYIGKAIDIDKECNLILKLENGRIKKVIEGDIITV